MGIFYPKKRIPNRGSSLNNSIDKQNITQNLDKNITNEQEIHQKELEDKEMIQLQDNNENNHNDVQIHALLIEDRKSVV